MQDFWFFFKEGLYHVLDWNAIDHILFFIVLAVPYAFKNWSLLLRLVTFFTLGHLISLFLATYNIITVSSKLIELLIPLTICITAFSNILNGGKKSGNSTARIFSFTSIFIGLIHGFGFSTYFKMMTHNKTDKLVPLAEYSLGIEAAQLLVVLIILILGFLTHFIFRIPKRDWVLVISSIVIGLTLPLLLENWQNFK